jgi:hypothetical protein
MDDADSPSSGIEPTAAVARRRAHRDGAVHARPEALGEHIFEWFLRNKRSEWRAYKTQVTPVRDRPVPAVDLRRPMDLLAVFPDPGPPDLARTLDLAGYRWKAVASAEDAAARARRRWRVPSSLHDEDPRRRGRSVVRCASATRQPSGALLVSGGQLADLELRDELFDDFCLTRSTPANSRRACGTCSGTAVAEPDPSWSSTASCPQPRDVPGHDLGRPLDLTYMEYELLKFLAQNPGKVFTREMLLSRVWGYEYYGGARTVDVHIRRLRAKLGEEHANLIQTVRSVGYRFGQSRWGT